MSLTQEQQEHRIELLGRTWEKARTIVDPLVDQHGVEKVTFSSFPFNVNDVLTPLDQHINSIIRVAEWLLGEGD
jgi:hypothetical protein